MMKLPEELAEEEDLRLCGFGPCLHHDHDHESNSSLSGFALWVNALGCSVSVSLASLVCLILLPVMFVQVKPAKWFVDALALFGAGDMLGDAFLHQLPHAFGGGHSHSHDHHESHDHHDHSNSPSHSHSIKDLSVGLSVLAEIVVFLLVEKLVRYVEENSSGSNTWGGHHHHHHAGSSKKLKDEDDHNNADEQCPSENSSEKLSKDKSLRKRKTSSASDDGVEDKSNSGADITLDETLNKPQQVEKKNSSLVFGYLNLLSDGVVSTCDR